MSQGKRSNSPSSTIACAPPEPFLGRLEDEVHRAVEVARLGQVARGAEQHRGVAVMAAGMHLARLGRLVARSSLASWIGSASMSARRPIGAGPLPVAQHADHAGAADAAMHLDAERSQAASATMSEVRCSSKPISGWAWKSRRHAVSWSW